MIAQRADAPRPPSRWSASALEVALAIAEAQAARCARMLHLSRADRDDLRQDMLVALLERQAQFDPARGGWGAFVAVVARSAAADHLRVRLRQRIAVVPLDLDLCPAGASATQRDCASPELGLDMQSIAAVLPVPQGHLLCLLVAAGDVATAQRVDGRSTTAFYRAVADLRCWLRAWGLRPPADERPRAGRRQLSSGGWEKSPHASVKGGVTNHA